MASISKTLLQLETKIERLEEQVQKLQSKTKDMITSIGFTVYTKNLLNLNIIKSYKFRLKTLENKNKSSQFFQVKIKFLNNFTQNITFNLFADNIQIASDTQNYSSGINEAIIYGTYSNLVSDKIVLELQIQPNANKQVTIFNTTLTIWGDIQNSNNEYSASESNDKYFLSYLSNNRLYYKIFKKNEDVNNVDFDFFEEAISHSSCCLNNNIYLFRVDLDGNLFFSNTSNFNEIFICNNVSKISCCATENKIIFVYIKNNTCFYGEINNDIVISNNKLNSPYGLYKDCYIYFNKFNNKCYIIITGINNTNYLLESINETNCSSENVKASINLNIEILEGN